MRFLKNVGFIAASLLLAPVAFAAVDLSSLTSEVDFSSVGTAVLAVAATLAGIYITWKAAGLVLRAIRGL
ncbi:MAG: hypothetical protein LBU76_00575 [Azoarcus sp.]|jgi:hypothetical protein|nr:hypothetical protein [Azoarcus sp.]